MANQTQPQPASNRLLNVMIRNREKVIYEGTATAVTSINDKGIFDILPEHINFISMIKEVLKIQKPDKIIQEYKIRTGIIRVNNNNVEVYVGLTPQVST
ncbi:MAG: hypothetical protein HYV40_06420 [Candidatus Levybacteria bacterium]|nr:hypothetical protein [Candidatus Levybacteria bacterium]